MSKPSILVTGAGGFIGGWFTEALHLAGFNVKAGVGRWASAARIARFPVEIVRCDITDPAALDAAMVGIDVVINCARAKTGGPDAPKAIALLLDRAKAAGVRQVIHLSSAATYGDASGNVDESVPCPDVLDTYSSEKRAGELACEAAASDQMKITVLRPTLVYGPFSDTWTVPYIARIKTGRWTLLGENGEGRANLVYVGDLIKLALHLISNAEKLPAYDVYNANGPEIPTWNEYFNRLSIAMGAPPLKESKQQVGLQVALRSPIRAAGKYVLANHRRLLIQVSNKYLFIKDILKVVEGDLRLKPNENELKLFRSTTTFSMEKARAIGFVPDTSLDDGIGYSVDWAKDLGLVH